LLADVTKTFRCWKPYNDFQKGLLDTKNVVVLRPVCGFFLSPDSGVLEMRRQV